MNMKRSLVALLRRRRVFLARIMILVSLPSPARMRKDVNRTARKRDAFLRSLFIRRNKRISQDSRELSVRARLV